MSPCLYLNKLYNLYIFPVLEHTHKNIKCFFPEMDDREVTLWFISLISQIGFTHSAYSLVSKYCGIGFYERDNLKKYALHVSRNIYESLRIGSSKWELWKVFYL